MSTATVAFIIRGTENAALLLLHKVTLSNWYVQQI